MPSRKSAVSFVARLVRSLAAVKISLERIDSHAFVVDLPGTTKEHVSIRSASGLRGVLEQTGDRLVLSEGAAERVALEALRLLLGELVLSSTEGATLEAVAIALDQGANHLRLDVAATTLAAAALGIVVDDVVLSGALTLTGARLTVRDAEGTLSADRVELSAFSLRVGDLELAAPTLTGREVATRWGAADFALRAAAFDAPALEVVSGDARVWLSGVHVDAFSLDGASIAAERATADAGRVAIALGPSSTPGDLEPEEPTAAVNAPPFFDLRTLDGLSGEIDVDVEVDITVPIIGHRRATHRLRVPVAGGALDYRALESNLSTLENALLDFAAKDGALRLERVNPLFPARGHGKPIVLWDLDAADFALAEQDRVRIAVLPSARLPDADEPESEPGDNPTAGAKKSSLALERLTLHRIGVNLALATVVGEVGGQLRLRSVGSILLKGSVDHAPGAETPRAGAVLGELSAVAASLVGLPVDESLLDIESVTLASASAVEVTFSDVHPTNVRLDLGGLVVERLELRPRTH